MSQAGRDAYSEVSLRTRFLTQFLHVHSPRLKAYLSSPLMTLFWWRPHLQLCQRARPQLRQGLTARASLTRLLVPSLHIASPRFCHLHRHHPNPDSRLLPGLAASLTGSFTQSPYTHFLHACFVPGVRNNPAPWELQDQVGKIRRANHHFKHVQGRTRSAHTLCHVSTRVKGQRLGFGRRARRVSAPGWAPLPPSSSLKPGACPKAVGQGHGHQWGRTATCRTASPVGGRAELEAAAGSLCCSFSDEKAFATEHPECPAVREPGPRNSMTLVRHQTLNRH